jgi:hypothetical protein
MKDFVMTKRNKRCLGIVRTTLIWGRSTQWKQSGQENHVHKFNVPMLQQDQKMTTSMGKMAEFYVTIVKHICAFNKICSPWSDVLYLGMKDITFKKSILVQVITKILSINEISPEQSTEITISLKLVGDHMNSKWISVV